MFLSIVIPCYNEERNIRLGALENVAHYLSRKKFSWEGIIVDDGSMDGSIELAERFCREHKGFRLMKRMHQGKAAAVVAGILAAKGEYILFTDLDQATPITQWDVLWPWFTKGFDLVIGSRNSVRLGAPLLRRAMARGFMLLRALILDVDIRDTQCGFKAFRKDVAFVVFPNLQVFRMKEGKRSGSMVTAGFDVETLFIAKRTGYKIAEVPVEWHYQETRHINPIKDSFESLIDLLRIRWNSMRGVYDRQNPKFKESNSG